MKVVIHPGFAKCGSTSLQIAVYKDAERLAQSGISLFGYRESHSDKVPNPERCLNEIYKCMDAYHKNPKLRRETARRIVGLLEEEIDIASRRKSKVLFITSEDLSFHLTEIANHMPSETPIDVFVMVRNPRSVLASHFNQCLKMGESYKSGTEYVKKVLKEKRLHFSHFVREIEQCSRVTRLIVARVDDESQNPLELLYRQCFGVKIEPPLFPKVNQAVSVEALSVIQCTVKCCRYSPIPSTPSTRNPHKKPTHRFFELLQKSSGPDFENWTQYEIWDQRLNSSSRAFARTMAGYGLQGAEMTRERRGTRLSVDEALIKLNHVPKTALRSLLAAALTVGFEINNVNEREWTPNFEDELAILKSQGGTRAESQHKFSTGFSFRDVMEILLLLSVPVSGSTYSPKRKSCSYRLLEIIMMRLKDRDLTKQESCCRILAMNLEGQLYRLLYTSIVQLWWEIFNEKEREWSVEWTSAEISFLKNHCHVIRTKHFSDSWDMSV